MPSTRPKNLAWESAQRIVQKNITDTGNFVVGVEQSLAHGRDMRVVACALGLHAAQAGIEYRCVGGRGAAANGLAAATSIILWDTMQIEKGWFMVRDKQKDHGPAGRWTEVARIAGLDVMVVDTVADPEALAETCARIEASEAQVTGIVPVVDLSRGDQKQFIDIFPGAVYAPLFSEGFIAPDFIVMY